MKYIVTVNRHRIDSGVENPIRVEDTATGEVVHVPAAVLGCPPNAPRIVSGPPRQDGATVWIECDAWDVIL